MNAKAPLPITSYDGSGQNVHPDVIRVPGGLWGYEFWMALTPYPFANDRMENPALRASQDGVEWVKVPGIPDPVIPEPPDSCVHHADPDLVYSEGELFLFYMTTNESARWTTFSVIRSRDGRSWSGPREVYRGRSGVSPTVVWDGTKWHMWHAEADAADRYHGATVVRRSADQQFEWGREQTCTFGIPGHVAWHLDVIKVESGFEALVAAFPEGADPSRCVLFHMISHDGLSFYLSSPMPLLRPSLFGWDNRMIYRSTFLKYNSNYWIWYSAMSWGKVAGIGVVSGPLHSLKGKSAGRHKIRPLVLYHDALGRLRYRAGRLIRSLGLR